MEIKICSKQNKLLSETNACRGLELGFFFYDSKFLL